MRGCIRLLLWAGLACGAKALAQGPLDHAFLYQGELIAAGVPATGQYDVRFRLFADPGSALPIGPTLCVNDLSVAGGRFSVRLDFGAQFGASRRYIEVSVREDTGLGCGDAAGFITLSPRQEVMATPQAGHALGAEDAAKLNGQAATFYTNATNLTSGNLPNARLSGTYTSRVNLTNTTNTFAGSGAGLMDLNATNIVTGTLADARLSTNIARLDQNAAFSGRPDFGGGVPGVSAPFTVTSAMVVTNLNADLLDGLSASAFAAAAHTHNAADIIGGTLADARLSTNIPRLNQNGVFTGRPAFNGGVTGTTPPFTVTSATVVTNLNADLLDGLSASAFAAATHTHSAADIIEGTLADARLGGNIARLDQNGAFSGRPAFNGGITGVSPPFTVTSATVVTNLNADLLDGLSSAAFAAAAHTHSAAQITSGTLADARLSGNIPRLDSASTRFFGSMRIGSDNPAAVTRLFVEGSGEVGDPQWAGSPPLAVFESSGNAEVALVSFASQPRSITFRSEEDVGYGAITFKDADGLTLQGGWGSAPLRLSPQGILHFSSATLTGTHTLLTARKGGVLDQFSLRATHSAIDDGASNNLSLFSFGLPSRPVMSWRGNGQVGIGTASPEALLDISNAGATNGVALLSFAEDDSPDFIFTSGFAGTGAGGNYVAFTTTWGANPMTWVGNGRVGIGTTSPLYPLHVRATDAILGIESDTSRDSWAYFREGGAVRAAVGYVKSSAARQGLNFQTGGQDRLTITDAGELRVPATARFLSVAPCAFQAENRLIIRSTIIFHASILSGESGFASAPVQLPAGATVRRVVAWCSDDSASQNLRIGLYRNRLTDPNSVIETLASISSSGSSGSQTLTDNTIANATIDTENYIYFLDLDWNKPGDGSIFFYGARIEYDATLVVP
ncbi:MAG: hypothetical protein JNK25_07605 [Phycisphaerae bacterium]|nr:hypothetical protein [Phycisphaerae bacterium]